MTEPYLKSLKRDFGLRLRNANFVLSVVGAVLIFVYATIAALQWRAMVNANKNSERALEVTERAYVNVQDVRLGQPLAIDGPAEAISDYKNTGLTPAMDLQIFYFFDVYFSRTPHALLPPRKVGGRLSGGGLATIGGCSPSRRVAPLGVPSSLTGGIMPPGVTWHLNTNPQKVTGEFPKQSLTIVPKEYSDIKNGTEFWHVGAVISYYDQFGHCHETAEYFIYNAVTDEFDPILEGFQERDS